MTISYQYITLIIAGLAGMIWGLPAAHRLKSPLDVTAAFVVLLGVVILALGTLLTFIPDFFSR